MNRQRGRRALSVCGHPRLHNRNVLLYCRIVVLKCNLKIFSSRCQLQSLHSPRRRIVTYAFQRLWVQKPTSNIHCKTSKTPAQPHNHCLVYLILFDINNMIKPRADLWQPWLVRLLVLFQNRILTVSLFSQVGSVVFQEWQKQNLAGKPASHLQVWHCGRLLGVSSSLCF